ncbi:MAG: hypothetical protein SFW67_30185 [Myxococcaceae bacterium]|nr:hypothetical protein [Myxococcaceae bacterium]
MPRISKPPTMPKTNPTKPGSRPKTPAPKPETPKPAPGWTPGKRKPVE